MKITKKPAFTLTEIVVMLLVLAVSITMAANLLAGSTDTTGGNRNNLLAENLANEALDAAQNLIYTNILLYGAENAEDCWIVYTQNVEFAENCIGNEIIPTLESPPVHGRLQRNYQEPNLHWQLSEPASELDLSQERPGNEFYHLYRKKITSDPQSPLATTEYYDYQQANNTTASPFYRSVTFTPSQNNVDQVLNEVDISVSVQWYEGRRLRQINKTVTANRENILTGNL